MNKVPVYKQINDMRKLATYSQLADPRLKTNVLEWIKDVFYAGMEGPLTEAEIFLRNYPHNQQRVSEYIRGEIRQYHLTKHKSMAMAI